MTSYLKHDEWLIIEEGFNPENNRASESILSLGNGKMGQRANFEEAYSGDTLQGNYIAGVYYPDKTRVGWWKVGYPEYFAKVLNAANWIGIDVKINDKTLDLAKCRILSFRRTLNMKKGYLERSFTAELPGGEKVTVESIRFLSIVMPEIGAIQYSVKPVNFNGKITITPYIDLDVRNEDANYGEQFWEEVNRETGNGEGYILGKTKKLDFTVCTGMKFNLLKNGKPIRYDITRNEREKYLENSCSIHLQQEEILTIFKYAVNLTSLDYRPGELMHEAEQVLKIAFTIGFENLLAEHTKAWIMKWDDSDIRIGGDVAAQQGIRFNIFHLNQTYTGEDERLNIGPKGFTGEKYGGSTYWDTEAFVFPFYLCTTNPDVGKKLLLYRYKHLGKAIENAQKLGFKNGAALYPMVTMNGEECHNEWEITFEEIHRNGAIAYAIYSYVRHTGDYKYLEDYGLEVLMAISRFWSQRVNFSEPKQKYVILGVTGPNEYENNVNNNWYTNTIAAWTLDYTMGHIHSLRNSNPQRFRELAAKLNFDFEEETSLWRDIVDNLYFPYDEEGQIFLQQDGYLDKEQSLAEEIDPNQRPINQHWSWDRILRSPFIKQADVLHGIYFFEERYDKETIRRNFNFYEPRTVHESSLSACIHSILAARIGDIDTAYNLYLRTARLDLDDYNQEVAEGLHITSMGGTWMAVVEGFGGMRIADGTIRFNPLIPDQWEFYSFNVRFKGNLLNVKVNHEVIEIRNRSNATIPVNLYDQEYLLEGGDDLVVHRKK